MEIPKTNRQFPYGMESRTTSHYEIKARENSYYKATVQLDVFDVMSTGFRPHDHVINIGLAQCVTVKTDPDNRNSWGQPKVLSEDYDHNIFAWISLERAQAEELLVALQYALEFGSFDKREETQ